MKPAEPAHGLPVLLPYRIVPVRMPIRISPFSAAILCFCAVMAVSTAWAQTAPTMLSPLLQVILKWSPLLLRGFAFNILISLLAMLLGTVAGLGLGLTLLSEFRPLASVSWLVTQFFRNVPWLALLFFVMFLVPFPGHHLQDNHPFAGLDQGDRRLRLACHGECRRGRTRSRAFRSVDAMGGGGVAIIHAAPDDVADHTAAMH